MSREETISKIQDVFRDVFDNEEITVSESTSANDIEEWDSLTNIQLIVSIEHEFGIKFDSEEMTSWANVGEMAACIESKIA